MPEIYHPEILQTTYVRNARRYAAALLGVDIEQLSCWGHMIRKLPGGRDAPWHQDEAYWDPELSYHALGCWLPLHAVTEEMGAMQFIPGSHKTGCATTRTTTTMPPCTSSSPTTSMRRARVVCPLPAGGATFHYQRTLHYTAPNTTDRPRLAFPIEFQVAPTTAGRRAVATLGRRQPRRHRTHPDQRLLRRRDLRQALTRPPVGLLSRTTGTP